MSKQNLVEFETPQSAFKAPKKSEKRFIIVSFDDQSGVDEFAKLMKQKITKKTKKLKFGDTSKFASDLFSEEE